MYFSGIMHQDYIKSKTSDKIDFTKNPPPGIEYESHTFTNCDFSNADLAGRVFINCEFENCNLSMAILIDTTLQDIAFKNCKMLGLHFENCNRFGLSVKFDGCNLHHASFFKTKLKKTIFQNSKLLEVDFTEGDFSGSVFENCDLMGSLFENTMLEKADFSTSFNYSIDPEKNRIKKARFSLTGLPGLLEKYEIDIA